MDIRKGSPTYGKHVAVELTVNDFNKLNETEDYIINKVNRTVDHYGKARFWQSFGKNFQKNFPTAKLAVGKSAYRIFRKVKRHRPHT